MIDTDEKVDARTVEEDMKTRNNMTWLNNRVVELEAEVKRLREWRDKVLHVWMHTIGPSEFAQLVGGILGEEYKRKEESE
tara:strand:- start:978 stop:1217 length:240 start_codon:yes stop_codon:yes gene_type:complete